MNNVATKAPPHYLTPAEAAAVLSVTTWTLSLWRRKGTGPQWIKVSPKMVRYERDALDRFLADRARDGF